MKQKVGEKVKMKMIGRMMVRVNSYSESTPDCFMEDGDI